MTTLSHEIDLADCHGIFLKGILFRQSNLWWRSSTTGVNAMKRFSRQLMLQKNGVVISKAYGANFYMYENGLWLSSLLCY
jgi:hypothetical protein